MAESILALDEIPLALGTVAAASLHIAVAPLGRQERHRPSPGCSPSGLELWGEKIQARLAASWTGDEPGLAHAPTSDTLHDLP